MIKTEVGQKPQILDQVLILVMSKSLLLARMLLIRVAELVETRVRLQMIAANKQLGLCAESKIMNIALI